MSFELHPGERVGKGVRRIAGKQLEGALAGLTGALGDSRDEVVHETRKAFKKVRAVLRLVRPVIGEKPYKRENTCLRDAGRPLTKVRDAKILIDTLDHLIEHFHEHLDGRSFAGVHKAAQARLRAVRKRVLDEQNAFAVVTETVRVALDRVKDWTDVPTKWSSLGLGLEAVYRRAGEACEEAAGDPTVEKLHEWRKQAKYLRYQLEILRPVWPERLAQLAQEADRMSDLLGDDHDLAVLRQTLTSHTERLSDADDTEMLLALIDRRRAELQQAAMVLGRRFFQEKPRAFAAALKGYWKTWRALSPSELPAEPDRT